MTPFELRALAKLRQRGQAPQLAVFVMDDWDKAAKLSDVMGALTIRVRNARDFEHDWAPVAGLWVYLWLRRATSAELANFSALILQANPARLTTRIGEQFSVDVWDASHLFEGIVTRCRRDDLLARVAA